MGVEGIDDELKDCIFVADDAENFSKKIEEINNIKKEKLLAILSRQQEIIIRKYDISLAIEKLVK